MPINFPDSPTVGQLHTVDGRTWRWTGAAWAGVIGPGIAGAQGPPGPQGAPGPQGPAGADGTDADPAALAAIEADLDEVVADITALALAQDATQADVADHEARVTALEEAPAGAAITDGDVAGSTGSLAADASADLALALGKAGSLWKIATSAAAWVRLYATAAQRAADAARLETADPTPGEILAEIRTTGPGAVPMALPFNNGDDPRAETVYARVTNRSGGAAAVTVTVNRTRYL